MAKEIKLKGTVTSNNIVLNRRPNGPVNRLMLQLSNETAETIISAAEAAGIKWQKNSNGQEYLPVGTLNIHRDNSARMSVFPVRRKDGSEGIPYEAAARKGDTIEISGIFAQKDEPVEFRNGKKTVSQTGYYITGTTGTFFERLTEKALAEQQKKLLESILSGMNVSSSDSDDK